MASLRSRIDFKKIKKFAPIIVIIGSFLYNLYKSKFKKNKELFIEKDGTFIKEDFLGYDVRRGVIGGDSNLTANKWILVAEIQDNDKPKSITLDIYPKGNGTSKQTFSFLLNKNKTKIYSTFDYGITAFRDAKVIVNGKTYQLWLQIGNNSIKDIPVSAHLDNIEEDDKIYLQNSTNLNNNLPQGTKYGISKEIKYDNLENKIKAVVDSANNNKTNIGKNSGQIKENQKNIGFNKDYTLQNRRYTDKQMADLVNTISQVIYRR